jgi:hypothetical protein
MSQMHKIMKIEPNIILAQVRQLLITLALIRVVIMQAMAIRLVL